MRFTFKKLAALVLAAGLLVIVSDSAFLAGAQYPPPPPPQYPPPPPQYPPPPPQYPPPQYPPAQATPTPTPTVEKECKSAIVLLHGDKTEVELGEESVFTLSVVNSIKNPDTMQAQVTIITPSGMSVTSSEFSTSGVGLFTRNVSIDRGEQLPIIVSIKSNQVGENFTVKGVIGYYFGQNLTTYEECTIAQSIKVRPATTTPAQTETPKSPMPGLQAIMPLILLVYFMLKGRRE